MIKIDLNKNEIIEIINCITNIRLSSYRNQENLTTEDLINLYTYNIKLNESLYPVLSVLEITLRNKICKAIHTLICKDWLLQELTQQNILLDNDYAKLLETAKKIQKNGKNVTNDRLISELTFGFWIHLCTKTYKPKLWDKKGFFELVFPNYQPNGNLRNITPIQKQLRSILTLRNRVFHHENIVNSSVNITLQYQMILDLLNLLSTGMLNYAQLISRFENIAKQKP